MPTITTRLAAPLTMPDRRGGRVRPHERRARECRRERDPGGEADQHRAERGDRQRFGDGEQRRPGGAGSQRAGHARRASRAGRSRRIQPPSGRVTHAEQQRERADRAGRALRDAAVPLQQLDDPVADDEAEAERGAVEHGEPVEPPVPQDPGRHVELALGPDAARIRRRRSPAARARSGADDERGPERRAPPEPPVQLRDDRERESAAGEPDPAEEALREGRPARLAHVRAAGDEAQAGADPDQRPRRDRERRLRRDERQAVERDRDRRARARAARRAPNRSAARPPGICIARWVTKSAVVNSPTTARLTS